MQEKYHKVLDYSLIYDRTSEKAGSADRLETEKMAYAAYTGKIIGDARLKAGMTQAELARLIGHSRSYVCRMENGEFEPKVSTFYRVMKILGRTVSIQ